MLTRRQLLASTLAAGSLAALEAREARGASRLEPARGPGPRPGGQSILILGGTGFLGPACMEAALARGHRVTLFNSGSTEAARQGAGHDSLVPAGVEILYGNRDPEKTASDRRRQRDPRAAPDPTSPKGLTQLQGKTWDAVIDTSGYWPRMVRASAELLAPSVAQYVFVSTVAVYRRTDLPGLDESAELRTLADPTSEENGGQMDVLGGAKALCEAAAEAALPGRVTRIRPGWIVGPRDPGPNFVYWPWRVAAGGELLVPGTPADPVQLIDVRDLGRFIVHCIEQRIVGAFNATGPAKPLTVEGLLQGCREAVGSDARFTWIPADFLREHGVEPGAFPLMVSPTPELAGIHRIDVARALASGLAFRSLVDTAYETMEWFAALPEAEQAQRLRNPPPVTAQQEAELLRLWRERKG